MGWVNPKNPVKPA